MKTQEELLKIDGGSVLIIRVVPSDRKQSDLVAAQLDRYVYAAKPYAATVVDISLGGYFISESDLTAMVMSLPAGSSEPTACSVVVTRKDALSLQKMLDVAQMSSFVRVCTSLEAPT
ncbi:MAG TPA: hypothetical protein VHA33_06035 [Candidatus Angelobacter sp.]|nr:hypothetical protein [Candidatus Angelobacter sp.]